MIKLRRLGYTISVILILEANFMKKLFSITLALVLIFALTACGCQAQDKTPATTAPTTVPTTVPTTAPTTEPTLASTVPSMDPTLETNIPDSSVDTSMPDNGSSSETGNGISGESGNGGSNIGSTDATGMDSRTRRR